MFLNCNQTFNEDLYSQQLQHVYENIRKRPALVDRRNIVLFLDNVKPRSARITQLKILDLGWYILHLPPYSPDLAPIDFFLFRFQQNAFNVKHIFQEYQVKTCVENFMSWKPAKFYLRGINKLLDRWQKETQNNVEYTID